MLFRRICIRLGMSRNLYFGICIGIIFASGIIIAGLFLIPLRDPGLLPLACSALLAGLLIAILLWYGERVFKPSEDLCTCRYRSSLYTDCRECALNDLTSGEIQRDHEEN